MNNDGMLHHRIGVMWNRDWSPQTPLSAAAKVYDEVTELLDNPEDIIEAADVLITLHSWCLANNTSWDDLVSAAHLKMRKNEQREWTRTPKGNYQHVGVDAEHYK